MITQVPEPEDLLDEIDQLQIDSAAYLRKARRWKLEGRPQAEVDGLVGVALALHESAVATRFDLGQLYVKLGVW